MTYREKLATALQETVAFHWRSKASKDDVTLDLLIRLRTLDLAVVPRKATEKMLLSAERPRRIWASFKSIYANMVTVGEVK